IAVDCTILAFVQFGSIALANPTCRDNGVFDKATNGGSQDVSLIFTAIQGDAAVPRSPTTLPPATAPAATTACGWCRKEDELRSAAEMTKRQRNNNRSHVHDSVN